MDRDALVYFTHPTSHHLRLTLANRIAYDDGGKTAWTR